MSDWEKEKEYREVVGFLDSSLSNEELIEESLTRLKALGEYRDAPALYAQYSALFRQQREEKARYAKRRRAEKAVQLILTGLGLALAGMLIFILVYALRLW